MNDSEVKQLLSIIERNLDWGSSVNWQGRDFDRLNQLIFERTKVSLSASTLRRLWGRVAYQHLPSGTTLNTLAKFAGYEDWRAFQRQQASGTEGRPEVLPAQPQASRSKGSVKIVWVTTAILLICLVGFYAMRQSKEAIRADRYSFSSRRLTRDIPNSVIFDYDATASPTDSVFIQQSWDMRTRAAVDKNLHQHTSIYYEPGFYQAKLLVNTQVVKQHPLLIPSKGWLGIIENNPVPVYLSQGEFMTDSLMHIPVSIIRGNNVALEPHPPVVKFYNVGNFAPVAVNSFSFSSEVKNEYHEGAAACQMINIILITDDVPIIIPLSAKGCVSELGLISPGQMISGKKADLSGFGADLSQWVKVSCTALAGKTRFYVDDKLACEVPSTSKLIKIVGVAYVFQGTGAVRAVRISSGRKSVFEAF